MIGQQYNGNNDDRNIDIGISTSKIESAKPRLTMRKSYSLGSFLFSGKLRINYKQNRMY